MGSRATSRRRTIVELAGRVSERELGNAIDSACRLGLTSPVFLRRRLDELGRRAGPGVAIFDRVMESAGVQSWLEREFEHLVRSAGPADAAPPAGLPPGRPARRPSGLRLRAVAGGGGGGRPRGYLSADDRRRQEHRRNELQLIGKIVYFFTTEDVVETPGYVISTLRAALGRRRMTGLIHDILRGASRDVPTIRADSVPASGTGRRKGGVGAAALRVGLGSDAHAGEVAERVGLALAAAALAGLAEDEQARGR
jgi:hypothetical protein